MPLASAAIRLIRVRGTPQISASLPADKVHRKKKLLSKYFAGMHRRKFPGHVRTSWATMALAGPVSPGLNSLSHHGSGRYTNANEEIAASASTRVTGSPTASRLNGGSATLPDCKDESPVRVMRLTERRIGNAHSPGHALQSRSRKQRD